MFKKIKNQRGFVLVEFVIALPLLVLLIYSLTQIMIQVSKLSKNQSAEYVLENEAHDILERITQDARSASSVEYVKSAKYETIILVFHADANSSYILTNDEGELKDIIDVRDTRRYIRYSKNYTEPIYHLYAQRQQAVTAPISGDNFLGDTSIESLKFSTHKENIERNKIGKILHISLEMKSMVTGRKIKLNTSVFMPACEEIKGIDYE